MTFGRFRPRSGSTTRHWLRLSARYLAIPWIAIMVAIIPSVVLEKRSGLLHITGLEILAGLLSDPRWVELTRLRGIPRIVEWCGLLSNPRWNKLARPLSVPLVIDWSGLSIPLLWNEWVCPERRLSHHEVVENWPVWNRGVFG